KVESVMEASFCILASGLQQQLSLDSIQLSLPPALSRVVHCCQRFSQHAEPHFGLSCFPIRLGQKGKIMRPFRLCTCGSVGLQALAYMFNAFVSLSLLHLRPAPPPRS